MLNSKTLVSSLALLITASAAHAGGASDSPAGTSNPIDQLDRPAVTRQVAPRIIRSTDGPASPSSPTVPESNGDTPTVPVHCASDVNNSGEVNWMDVIDFLNMYFADDKAADFDQQGSVDLSDMYKFIDAWTSGC